MSMISAPAGKVSAGRARHHVSATELTRSDRVLRAVSAVATIVPTALLGFIAGAVGYGTGLGVVSGLIAGLLAITAAAGHVEPAMAAGQSRKALEIVAVAVMRHHQRAVEGGVR